MRTVCTGEPLKQLEGFVASLFPAAKVGLGATLVVLDDEGACGIFHIPEKKRPGAFVAVFFRTRRRLKGGDDALQKPRQRDQIRQPRRLWERAALATLFLVINPETIGLLALYSENHIAVAPGCL